jgi:hypothetical protein
MTSEAQAAQGATKKKTGSSLRRSDEAMRRASLEAGRSVSFDPPVRRREITCSAL